jgi:hypothetical protein
MDRFYEVSEDTIETFNDVVNRKVIPVAIKFLFIGDSKQKSAIKISKIPDDYAFVLGKEVRVTINEDILDAFDEDLIEILMHQEVDKIDVNIESGKIKMSKPDLVTTSGVVNRYGIEKVARANKVEELYKEQQEDEKNDFIA